MNVRPLAKRDPRQEIPQGNDQLICPKAPAPDTHDRERRGHGEKSKGREESTRQVAGTRYCKVS